MKFKKLLCCPISLVLCAALCGCSMSVSIENLLSPPKLSEEQEEIYRELEKSVGRNIKLKYPRSGDYRSAFVICDIDSEPGDEALVFYEGSDIRSGESALRLKFLDKRNGKWEAAFDLACPGNEIDSVTFADLGGVDYSKSDDSSGLRIILSYTLLNQTEKAVSVLKYEDGTPTELLSSTCSCMEVTDLNDDGKDELIIVTANKDQKTAAALMYADNEDSMRLISSTALRGGASDYLRVTKGYINETAPALFFDYSKGGGQSGTDVLYCYRNGLYCPADASGKISRQVNDYMAEVYSFDINGDDIVEIPATEPLPGYETALSNGKLCAVRWYTVRNDSFVENSYGYYSGKYRFSLLFPERWIGVVTAVVDYNSNSVIFIVYDPETGLKATADNEIMRIRIVEKSDADGASTAEDLPILDESDDLLFCYVENERCEYGDLALSGRELEDNFVIMDNV